MIQTLTIARLQAFCGVVQQCFPRAHVAIAGGAPRDILNGRPVKDIDVFIELDSDDEDELTNDWANGCTRLGNELHSTWTEASGPDADIVSQTSIASAMNTKGYSYGAFSLVDFPEGLHMHPVQLVFIDEHPVENVKRHFDFGLSQVWVTPNQLRMTPAYWQDHFGHQITYLNSAEPNEQRRLSSIHRLKRLREKYAGWRFERCGGLVMPIPASPTDTNALPPDLQGVSQ